MRKIISFFLLFVLIFFFTKNSAFAARGDQLDCFSCPRVEGKNAHPYRDAAGWRCYYVNDDVSCQPGQPVPECSSESRDPNPNPPAACPDGQICRASPYEGCMAGDPPPEDQCEINTSVTCTISNDQCRKGLGNTCSKNYCVYKDLKDNKFYLMNEKALAEGKTPLCRQLDSPPEEKDAPKPNSPLSQPCKDPDPMWGCKNINTALGGVGTQAPQFVRWVLSFVLGISGIIVLFIIIITGYRLMTSQGDPEKVKNAREALTAAVVGLLFIIFSLVILQLITVNILQLPGFSR